MARRQWFLALVLAVPVVLMVVMGIGGYAVFTKSRMDPMPQRADAIIVLGGEHDGREAYGIELAKQGIADTVVLSNPYGSKDKTMAKYCDASTDQYEVLCIAPEPSTTRGEAIFTQRLADERGWTNVVVVSWRYHLPRARYIFENCFDGNVSMRAVPRSYPFSLVHWEFTYLYQVTGFVKAGIQGSCSDVT